MRYEATRPIGTWVLLVAIALSACSGDTGAGAPTSTRAQSGTTSTEASTEAALAELLAQLPPEARASNEGGDPRPPGYWAVWNSCAPGNRAAEAEANGGRAAGWLIVDDVLADPGIGLGDHLLASCEESVALLDAREATSDILEDPVFGLAAELLAAELNLTAGAETCPAADEAVVGAHVLLAAVGFDGTSLAGFDADEAQAASVLTHLLAGYNSGDLCR